MQTMPNYYDFHHLDEYFPNQCHMPVSQSCTVATSEKSWWTTGQSQARHTNSWFLAATKAPKVCGFHTHTVALWSVGQPSILSAKFDCPEAHQDFSLLATVKLAY